MLKFVCLQFDATSSLCTAKDPMSVPHWNQLEKYSPIFVSQEPPLLADVLSPSLFVLLLVRHRLSQDAPATKTSYSTGAVFEKSRYRKPRSGHSLKIAKIWHMLILLNAKVWVTTWIWWYVPLHNFLLRES